MPKPKYSIKDLKRRPETDPLPADIDEIPLSFARQFNSDELIVALQKMKANRWFERLCIEIQKMKTLQQCLSLTAGFSGSTSRLLKAKM